MFRINNERGFDIIFLASVKTQKNNNIFPTASLQHMLYECLVRTFRVKTFVLSEKDDFPLAFRIPFPLDF